MNAKILQMQNKKAKLFKMKKNQDSLGTFHYIQLLLFIKAMNFRHVIAGKSDDVTLFFLFQELPTTKARVCHHFMILWQTQTRHFSSVQTWLMIASTKPASAALAVDSLSMMISTSNSKLETDSSASTKGTFSTSAKRSGTHWKSQWHSRWKLSSWDREISLEILLQVKKSGLKHKIIFKNINMTKCVRLMAHKLPSSAIC